MNTKGSLVKLTNDYSSYVMFDFLKLFNLTLSPVMMIQSEILISPENLCGFGVVLMNLSQRLVPGIMQSR